MKYRIHFDLMPIGDQFSDSVIIEADTIEEIQRLAQKAVSERGGFDPWSEEIDDE